MANFDWTDGAADGNFGTAGNWNPAGVPASSNTYRILTSSRAIVSGMAQGALTGLTLVVGGEFSGSVGTPASPLVVGSVTELRYDAKLCSSFNINPGTCTAAYIRNAHPARADSFYGTAGTWTLIHIVGGPTIRFGASATLAALYSGMMSGAGQPIGITLDSGLTLTAATMLAGTVQASCAATTINLAGHAVWNHVGSSTGNIATLNQWGGSFYYDSPGMTMTKGNIYGGLFDCRRDGRAKTITNLDGWPGARVVLDNLTGTLVCTNNPIDYGAGIVAGRGITVTPVFGGVGAN